ncbi:unnamed protein product [Ranitomeya imitator]|uniref:VWFA domain-containing protein n=1 Tax=Ranitomeya imitator TaxID=111125 RepID=A0ABN9M3E3_9NEOB|nr:unnamed protein product [Ranitomeya imitator]
MGPRPGVAVTSPLSQIPDLREQGTDRGRASDAASSVRGAPGNTDGPAKRPVPTVHGPRLTTLIEKTTTAQPVERLPQTTLSQMSKFTSAAARGTSGFVSEPVCAKVKADIVFLVDESSSIGSGNFNKVKDFLYRIVSYFPKIGPQGTQASYLTIHYCFKCENTIIL